MILDRVTGQKIGTGTRHRGLWYIDREGPDKMDSSVLAAMSGEKETMAMTQHCRMGHISFDKMYKVFPDIMKGVDKSKLK